MKRYWYLMAIAATLLASCNKDEEETEIQGFKVLEYRPAPGQLFKMASTARQWKSKRLCRRALQQETLRLTGIFRRIHHH